MNINKILKRISLIGFNVFSIIFGFALIFSSCFANNDIRVLLNEHVFGSGWTETFTSGKPGIYYKSWYTSIKDLQAGNAEFASAAESEGVVLLKNDNNVLPLKNTDKVSLFGVTAYNPIYTVLGAGHAAIETTRKQYFDTEFKNAGMTLNEDLISWYKGNTSYYRANPSGNGSNATVKGAAWSAIPEATKTKSGFKTAIFITGRIGNEAVDLPPVASSGNSGLTDGDYLKLTSQEDSVLRGLKQEKDKGTFDKIIVLFNTANHFQQNIVNNPEYGIDGAMWVGCPGSDGIRSIANLLVGKVNPSGKLSTTWFSGRKENPNWNYFGTSGTVIYQEGIYIGYKYAETRYEDYVMGSENAGTYDYEKSINFPFGYGLSYTTFSQEFLELVKDDHPSKNYDYKGDLLPAELRRKAGDDLIAKVKVTNTGKTYGGKDVVQIYAQQPITADDKAHLVEKPSVELVGFAKTNHLAPGQSQTVEVKIDANKLFASFDREKNGYVLSEGNYLLAIGNGSHEAVNNILAQKGFGSSSKMFGTGDSKKVKVYEVNKTDSANYKYWTQGDNDVTPLFDISDPNRCDPNGNKITFMSRYNWKATKDDIDNTRQSVTSTTLRNKGKTLDSNGDFTNAKTNYPYYSDEYPTYGKVLDKKLNLIDMRGVEYDDDRGATAESKQQWEDFLDQLSWDDTVTLVSNGRRMTQAVPSIGKPKTNDLNASNGIAWRYDPTRDSGEANGSVGFAYHFDKANRNIYPTGYPCTGIIAATFNIEIAEVIGKSIGEDALWAGTSGLYGFGFNLHRNPYHGRAGEYYSDDPFLSGVIGGYESKGAQSKGLYVYNKHFVLNDQETGRSSYITWITEQAMRQEHLRPFEIAIEIGDAMNVMTAFSRIGTYWSGNCYNLMTSCLRGEFGMRGFAVTDWYKSSGMGMCNGLLAGQDLPDGSSSSEISKYGPNEGNHGYLAQAARVSARRILYTVANSNAMNFLGNNTRVVVHDPEWYAIKDGVLLAIYIAFGAFTALAVGFSVASIVNNGLKKRED